MVLGFVIHTVGVGPGEGPELCRVLYSHLFSCSLLEEKMRTDESALEKEKARRMDQIAIVARQSESMCLLSRQVSGRPATDFVIQSIDEPVPLHEDDAGMYGLSAGDPFPQEVTVLWMGVFSLGFSLICDPLDNLTLAEITLRMLVRYLVDALKLLTNGTNVILRADKIHMSLDKFMPQGHLLFLTHQATQALEKELNNAMTM
ncbi:AP-5 complex subunit sigma-1 [Mantella aurantiaca]